MTIQPRDLMLGLQQKLPQMLALIERLVNIDSGSYDREGVNRVSAILAEELERTGFAITRHAMPECAEVTADLIDAVLDEASKFASEVLDPINHSGDVEGCTWKDGEVTTNHRP